MATESFWMTMCGGMVQQYNVPPPFVKLNVETEQLVRHRLKAYLDAAVTHPFSRDMAQGLQVTCYLYFAAFSGVLCAAFHPESDYHCYTDKFCLLSGPEYLKLCNALYSVKVICAERHTPDDALIQLGTCALMCGQSKGHIQWWLECFDVANDEERFASEVRLRVYREAAEVLHLPLDEKSIRDARRHTIWTGLAVTIAEQHVTFGQTKDCLDFAVRALGEHTYE